MTAHDKLIMASYYVGSRDSTTSDIGCCREAGNWKYPVGVRFHAAGLSSCSISILLTDADTSNMADALTMYSSPRCDLFENARIIENDPLEEDFFSRTQHVTRINQ